MIRKGTPVRVLRRYDDVRSGLHAGDVRAVGAFVVQSHHDLCIMGPNGIRHFDPASVVVEPTSVSLEFQVGDRVILRKYGNTYSGKVHAVGRTRVRVRFQGNNGAPHEVSLPLGEVAPVSPRPLPDLVR